MLRVDSNDKLAPLDKRDKEPRITNTVTNHIGDKTVTDSQLSISQIDIGQRLSEVDFEESKIRE
jgi:hypothetical protein